MYERPKMVRKTPFLTSYLQTPKDIATTKGEGMSGNVMLLYHHAKFHAISGTTAEISVPDKKYSYIRFNIRQNAH